jgi:hypothetical protein
MLCQHSTRSGTSCPLERGSAHFHHDEGEIVVLLRVADPLFHLGGNPRADLVSREVSSQAEQLLQALLAELFVLGIVRIDSPGEKKQP